MLAAVFWAAVGPASAQGPAGDFPTRPVTIVTPFAAGSGPDAVVRLVGEKLGRLWNQRVAVDNKPGGGGFIAIDAARRASPDGYTLLQLDSEHLAAAPLLYKQRGFRTFEVFDPVAALFRTPFIVTVPASSNWKSVGDLVAAARAQGGEMLYGSWGIGSPGHLGAELLANRSGVQMRHVPYREISQLFMSVAAGDVAWSFGSIPSSMGTYKAGKIRYLAIAAPKRIAQLPDVPTVAELGGPADFDVNSFAVLMAPKGTPAGVRSRIQADVAKVLADPEVLARFNTFAFEPLAWGGDEIQRQSDIKSQTYAELIRRANITLD